MLTYAGNDTTSTALCAALFYLGKNLHAYEKLAAEIRTKFSVLDGIGQDETLRNCHYLHACTYESLRMSPPVGSSMWREVEPGGTSIDGEFIPCGYGVGTGIYSIHHNPKYFPRPHDFIPERWLSEKDGFICKEQADIPFAAYILFSAGTRACLGRHLAITELLTTIAALVLLYDFRISHTENGELGCGHALGRHGRTNPGEFQLYHRVTSGKEGPILQLRPRKGNQANGLPDGVLYLKCHNPRHILSHRNITTAQVIGARRKTMSGEWSIWSRKCSTWWPQPLVQGQEADLNQNELTTSWFRDTTQNYIESISDSNMPAWVLPCENHTLRLFTPSIIALDSSITPVLPQLSSVPRLCFGWQHHRRYF